MRGACSTHRPYDIRTAHLHTTPRWNKPLGNPTLKKLEDNIKTELWKENMGLTKANVINLQIKAEVFGVYKWR
jgi:hypothetical protein